MTIMAGARIAVVAVADPGHAFPALALAEALRSRRHEVLLVTGVEHRAAAVATDLAFAELPAVAQTSDDGDLGRRLWGLAADVAPALADVLTGSGDVDLVISDVLTGAGGFAADLLGTPWIELSPHHLTLPDPELPPMGLGRLPSDRWIRRRDDDRLRRLHLVSLERGRRQATAARTSIGLSTRPTGPVARLVATLPGLEYPRRTWPSDTHLVGPLAWDPPWPPLPLPEGDDPLVLVTDSTADIGFSLVALALQALAGMPIRLVGTTTREDLQPWPRGCVLGRGPHGPLLDHAAAAVGLGGHGFLGKALSRGVPVVIVPWQGDQPEAAARVVWAGAGRRIPPRRLTGRRLRRAVRQVLADDRYTSAATALGRGAQGLGAAHAAGVVETYLR